MGEGLGSGHPECRRVGLGATRHCLDSGEWASPEGHGPSHHTREKAGQEGPAGNHIARGHWGSSLGYSLRTLRPSAPAPYLLRAPAQEGPQPTWQGPGAQWPRLGVAGTFCHHAPQAGCPGSEVHGTCWAPAHPLSFAGSQRSPNTPPDPPPSLCRPLGQQGPQHSGSPAAGRGSGDRGAGGKRDVKPLPASQPPSTPRGSSQRPRLPVPLVPLSPPRSPWASALQQHPANESGRTNGVWPSPPKRSARTGQQCPLVATAVSATTASPASGWTLGDRHCPTRQTRRSHEAGCSATCPHVHHVSRGSCCQHRRTTSVCPLRSTLEGHRAQTGEFREGFPEEVALHPAETEG